MKDIFDDFLLDSSSDDLDALYAKNERDRYRDGGTRLERKKARLDKRSTKVQAKIEKKASNKAGKQATKALKKAAVNTMPGTTKLEKKLNYAGAKATARKLKRKEDRADRKEARGDRRDARKTKRAARAEAKNPTPVSVSRKLTAPKSGAPKINAPKRNEIKTVKETNFKAAFAAARKAQGPNGTFKFNGKKYTTKRKDD